MSTLIAQEAPLGRKARRQRFALQKIDELSAEIALLRSRLRVTEEASSEREAKARELQDDLVDQLKQLQNYVAELEKSLPTRTLETERLERNIDFLRHEIDEVRSEKERLRLDNNRLAAENKGIKVDRARDEIEAWRAIGHKPPWKRCYERIEEFFRNDSDDRRRDGFEYLLRLPPP